MRKTAHPTWRAALSLLLEQMEREAASAREFGRAALSPTSALMFRSCFPTRQLSRHLRPPQESPSCRGFKSRSGLAKSTVCQGPPPTSKPKPPPFAPATAKFSPGSLSAPPHAVFSPGFSEAKTRGEPGGTPPRLRFFLPPQIKSFRRG
ncbi:hypothetical protein CRENBAI_013116 [Crenichthys baileyi]|uniref:Uncharacterized protein n=1 Tax=Crenichthys baileyi TaxID=28760 RepID=A0AAV9QT59_9TELE